MPVVRLRGIRTRLCPLSVKELSKLKRLLLHKKAAPLGTRQKVHCCRLPVPEGRPIQLKLLQIQSQCCSVACSQAMWSNQRKKVQAMDIVCHTGVLRALARMQHLSEHTFDSCLYICYHLQYCY